MIHLHKSVLAVPISSWFSHIWAYFFKFPTTYTYILFFPKSVKIRKIIFYFKFKRKGLSKMNQVNCFTVKNWISSHPSGSDSMTHLYKSVLTVLCTVLDCVLCVMKIGTCFGYGAGMDLTVVPPACSQRTAALLFSHAAGQHLITQVLIIHVEVTLFPLHQRDYRVRDNKHR